MYVTWRYKLLTAAIALFVVGAAESGQALAQPGVRWDCVRNDTGVDLKVYIMSEQTVKEYRIPSGRSQTFPVRPNRVRVVLVAYEANTNRIVNVSPFFTFPQNRPPHNCFPIYDTGVHAEAREAMESAATEDEAESQEAF